MLVNLCLTSLNSPHSSFSLDIFREDPRLLTIKANMGDSTGLFIVEAKLYYPAEHIPQAVAKFYACAKHLK